MTVITGSFQAPSQSGNIGASGTLWWVATARYNGASSIVLPQPFPVQVDSNGNMTPINVDPTGSTWVWKVTESFNTIASTVRYVQVPNSSSPVAYKDLVDVDITTLAPAAVTPTPAWVAMAQSTVNSGSIVGNDLVLSRTDGTTVDAGNVRGPQGLQGAQGIQGIQGAKGDPGGFSAATDLGASDLNTITTPGLYRQSNGANATLANNYPANAVTGAGALVVTQGVSTSDLLQQYTPVVGANSAGRATWMRRYYAGAWGTWYVDLTQRVDQTAGRAIYQWDDLNQREQLVWGDTGVRAIDSILNGTLFDTTGTARTLKMRRVGSMVTITGQILSTASVTAGSLVFTIPTGFRPDSMVEATGLYTNGPYFLRLVIGNGTNTLNVYWPVNGQVITWASGQVVQFTLSYMTSDAWPTTLPGAASGTIPNS